MQNASITRKPSWKVTIRFLRPFRINFPSVSSTMSLKSGKIVGMSKHIPRRQGKLPSLLWNIPLKNSSNVKFWPTFGQPKYYIWKDNEFSFPFNVFSWGFESVERFFRADAILPQLCFKFASTFPEFLLQSETERTKWRPRSERHRCIYESRNRNRPSGGINRSDQAAYKHDLAYKSQNLEDRHKADEIMIEEL